MKQSLRIARRVRRYRDRGSSLVKWLSYSSRQTRLLTNPDRMYLESTNVCNLRCVMCPNGLGMLTRPKGFMDYDLFTQIIDEMAPRVKTTTLHIWGEPLLHPRFVEMFRYLREQAPHQPVEFSTNGSVLTSDKARELVEVGFEQINFSLDESLAIP